MTTGKDIFVVVSLALWYSWNILTRKGDHQANETLIPIPKKAIG
ncbi:hypothetical protein [Brevibacillus reuszeri]|nr:hypothetical protein [Brevibacillus reuszeri]